MTICYHTYLRWDEEIAVCAVCSQPFLEFKYDPKLFGVFVREELARENAILTASTVTLSRPQILAIDGSIIELV